MELVVEELKILVRHRDQELSSEAASLLEVLQPQMDAEESESM